MCGIAGSYEFSRSGFTSNREVITKMCRKITHRGPDDEGIYIDEKNGIGLGHRRLSIIDLSNAGHQPMSNKDQSIWIVYNGEIYNHHKMREELEAKGYQYRSHCDTETLIYLYEQKGEAMLDELEGMFAFTIWDSRKKKLFMARDRIGIKPFYYYIKDGIFIFGSEIKAILEHPLASRKMNKEALYHYLTFITTPAPMTLFEDIHKMPPGYSMTLDSSGNLKLKKYWDVPVKKVCDVFDEDYYIEETLKLLKESIRKRTMSDVPFGTFLSGGVDSSMNVALMTEILGKPVNTFSVGFKGESEHNEFHYARKVAKKFNANHNEVAIDNKDFMDFFPTLVHHQDEPLADPVCIPLHFVSKLARDRGVPVIQVGEGADELFFGYTGYEQLYKLYPKWKAFDALPRFIKSSLFNTIGQAFDSERKDFIKCAVDSDPFFLGSAIAFRETEKEVLLNRHAKNRFSHLSSNSEVKRTLAEYKAANNDPGFISKLTYTELKMRLPELLLMRVDKVSMISSIETRVPFLDHHLVEFAMSIPPKLKRKGGMTKYVLKKVAEKYLDHEIIYRKKAGFCGSSRNMLTPELLDYSYDIVVNSPLSREYFQGSALEEIFKVHKEGKEEKSLRIWNLLNLALWHKHWFE